MHLDEDNLEEALIQFKKAIEVNPKNTFEYYNLYVFTAFLLRDNNIANEVRPVVKDLIEEYMPLYEQNLHFTQRDGEILHVDELEKMLGL